jgi:Proprotein convertase P-domain
MRAASPWPAMNDKLAGRALLLAGVVFVALASTAFATTKTHTYTSGTLSRPIVDNSLFVSRIKVPDKGKVKDVDVKVRLNHADDGDVFLALVSPAGKTVNLTSDNGDNGANFGTGQNSCQGQPTIFNDEAATSIADPAGALPPFAGSFIPEQPLSKFHDQVHGIWSLVVGDDNSPDTGTLGCWKLTIKRKT